MNRNSLIAMALVCATMPSNSAEYFPAHQGGTYKGGPNHEPARHRGAARSSLVGGQVAHRKNRAKGRSTRR